jgi:hypothetical protein
MTELTLVPPPPVKRRPRRGPTLVVLALFAVVLAGSVFGSIELSRALVPDTPSVAVASAGLPFQQADDVPVCAASVATAWNDARVGTGGQVNFQGPGVVIVDVGYMGRTRELQQQITRRDNMMTWDMPLYAQADSIRISVKTNGSYSTCQIAAPSFPGVTRSRPLYGVIG